ncbi:MAG: hypothetical protein ACRC4O_09585, partial [Giesbergeria sp.]
YAGRADDTGVDCSWSGWDCTESWTAYRCGDALVMHWVRQAYGQRHDRDLWVEVDAEFFPAAREFSAEFAACWNHAEAMAAGAEFAAVASDGERMTVWGVWPDVASAIADADSHLSAQSIELDDYEIVGIYA